MWGGISRNGATDVCIFNGTMNSLGYQQILDRYLIPFTDEAFPNGFRLVMDNDPKHTSKSTKQYIKNRNINHWQTPPQSPVSI